MKKALTTLAVLLIACFIIVLMTNSFGVFGLIIGIIISLGISIMALRKYKSDAMKKIKEIESEHPRFSEFYMANRNKQPIQMSEIAEIITVTAMYTQFFKEE
jgi:MFS superfamily sulfate permease-like transporter